MSCHTLPWSTGPNGLRVLPLSSLLQPRIEFKTFSVLRVHLGHLAFGEAQLDPSRKNALHQQAADRFVVYRELGPQVFQFLGGYLPKHRVIPNHQRHPLCPCETRKIAEPMNQAWEQPASGQRLFGCAMSETSLIKRWQYDGIVASAVWSIP